MRRATGIGRKRGKGCSRLCQRSPPRFIFIGITRRCVRNWPAARLWIAWRPWPGNVRRPRPALNPLLFSSAAGRRVEFKRSADAHIRGFLSLVNKVFAGGWSTRTRASALRRFGRAQTDPRPGAPSMARPDDCLLPQAERCSALRRPGFTCFWGVGPAAPGLVSPGKKFYPFFCRCGKTRWINSTGHDFWPVLS